MDKASTKPQQSMEFKIISLNAWGLHVVDAKYVKERLKHIAQELPRYDIVCLQEIWSIHDYEFLTKKLSSSLPYSHHYVCGLIGTGLCIFSRFPIAETFTHEFSVTGGVREILDGEVFACKGAMLCRVTTPLGRICVLNTHTNPRYRNVQLFEITELVRQASHNDPVILCGDFNTKPTHLAYQLITKYMNFHDSFADNPVDTCDLKSNIFTKPNLTPKRIDFIFYSNEYSPHLRLFVVSKKLALSGTIPGMEFPYSDHEGLEATFTLEQVLEDVDGRGRSCDQTFSTEGAQVLAKISSEVRSKLESYRYSIRLQFVMVLSLLIGPIMLSLILCSQYVYTTLATYSLHYLAAIASCSLGSFGFFLVTCIISDVRIKHGLRAKLSTIDTILKTRTNSNSF